MWIGVRVRVRIQARGLLVTEHVVAQQKGTAPDLKPHLVSRSSECRSGLVCWHQIKKKLMMKENEWGMGIVQCV